MSTNFDAQPQWCECNLIFCFYFCCCLFRYTTTMVSETHRSKKEEEKKIYATMIFNFNKSSSQCLFLPFIYICVNAISRNFYDNVTFPRDSSTLENVENIFFFGTTWNTTKVIYIFSFLVGNNVNEFFFSVFCWVKKKIRVDVRWCGCVIIMRKIWKNYAIGMVGGGRGWLEAMSEGFLISRKFAVGFIIAN